ncbi:hypothetical protein RQP46_005533 [Phenoliferia psychrophenolica]
MGIALWLAPSQSSLEGIHLSSLITSLATNHSTPLFAPHVTLLTGIDASTPPTELLATIRSALATFPTPAGPFSLTLTSLGSKADEKNYFQYLFVKVDPNAKLLALRKAVREALLPEAVAAKPDDFFPHLSLMYGEDTKNHCLPGFKRIQMSLQ